MSYMENSFKLFQLAKKLSFFTHFSPYALRHTPFAKKASSDSRMTECGTPPKGQSYPQNINNGQHSFWKMVLSLGNKNRLNEVAKKITLGKESKTRKVTPLMKQYNTIKTRYPD